MLLDDFLALLVSGLTIGSVYAMVGVSLNIAYRPTNVFNMAQGELMMLGMLLAWGLMANWSLPWFLGAAVVLVATALTGVVEERLAVAPILKKSTHSHGWIISTLAFSIVLLNGADRLLGSDPRPIPPMPGTSLDVIAAGPVTFSTVQLATIAFAVASIGAVEWLYRSTRGGKAVVAVATDRDGARLCGINPERLTVASFAAGGAYGAFAGLLAGPTVFASTTIGIALLIKGFIALAIGGVGSNWGTLVGGLAIGVIEHLSSGYLSPGEREVLLLVVLLGVLVVRPHGLFGRGALREV